MQTIESKILTDLEMTRYIEKHVKGGNHHKRQIKDAWLEFTEQAYEETGELSVRQFIEKVNKWLKTNKIPINVLSFDVFDENIGGTDWEVEEIDV